MLIGRIASASPQAGGTANLDSITAVVIGGTSLFGGRGRVIGTLFGALIVGVLRNGLTLAGVDVALAGLRRRHPDHRRGRDRPVDPEGEGMTATDATPILEARGLVKRYGHVTALAGSDFDLLPGRDPRRDRRQRRRQVLADQVPVGRGRARRGRDPARRRADPYADADRRARATASRPSTRRSPSSPALDIADNLFLGREPRAPGILGTVFRMLDRAQDARRGRASR